MSHGILCEKVGQAGQGGEKVQEGKGGKTRGEEPNPPPAGTQPTATHQATARAPTRARHGAIRARQRGGVTPRLRNSTPGQGARATRRPGRTHTQHHAPAGTTAKSTKPPQQTATPDSEQAQAPQSPQRGSQRPHGRVCARQHIQSLAGTKQPPSRWMCVRPAVNPDAAGYETAAVQTDVCAPGSEPSPCRLRNSRRPDGSVCNRQ